jgi:hypothetical protein
LKRACLVERKNLFSNWNILDTHYIPKASKEIQTHLIMAHIARLYNKEMEKY